MTARSSTAAVAVGRPGELTAYGRWHRPESVVCWASGTKVFLAALVRSLVRQGRLSWATPVGDLLGVAAPPTMTVTALVEHRSGLPRALPEQKATLPDPYADWTTDRFDERVLGSLPALAALGTAGEYAYSNLGYAVLARAIERSEGRAWLDLVREHVVQPLGVPGDAVLVAPPQTAAPEGQPGLSTLVPRTLRERPVAEWDTSRGPFAAAGGLCSTVPDMVRILRAALDADSPLLPEPGPHAWTRRGRRAWHAGALLRSGSLLVLDTATRAVGAAHALGGLPGHGARYAERALGALLAKAPTSAPAPAVG